MVGRKTADKDMLLIDVVKFCIEWQVQDVNLFSLTQNASEYMDSYLWNFNERSKKRVDLGVMCHLSSFSVLRM